MNDETKRWNILTYLIDNSQNSIHTLIQMYKIIYKLKYIEISKVYHGPIVFLMEMLISMCVFIFHFLPLVWVTCDRENVKKGRLIL